MKKKFTLTLTITLLIFTSLIMLVGCKNANFNYDSIKADYSDVQVSDNEGVNVVATPEAADNGVVTFDPSSTSGITKSFSIKGIPAGKYALLAEWNIQHTGLTDSEIEIKINDEVVSERTSLKAEWQNESNDFGKDKYGNQVIPKQMKSVENDGWVNGYLYEYDFATVVAPIYEFADGVNTIDITVINGGEFKLRNLRVKSVQLPDSYSDYQSKFQDKPMGANTHTVEAEHFAHKNSISVVPSSSSAINVTPYATYNSMLNTISGFDSPEQILSYKVNAETDGLYSLSFNYNNSVSNRTAYVQVFVDGETPFRELLRYPLQENGEFGKHTLGNANGNYAIYLPKGEHTISIKIDSSLTIPIQKKLTNVIDSLNGIYLDLKQVAGTVSDNNREWDMDNDFPGIVDALKENSDTLKNIVTDLQRVNGSDINFQALIYVMTAQQAIDSLLKTPKQIPNQYAEISEGSGSIVQTLANSLSDVQSTAVSFDKFVLHPANKGSNIKGANGFKSFWEGVKQFFHSFFADYSNTSDDDEKTIEVWVARSRQYVDLMQKLFDASDFREDTGYNVRFSILADEGKLILSNAAGVAPNAVMGISNWLPYEMGIRNLTVDLCQFDDYGDVIGRFSEGAMISLIADGIGLGLPETQDFYVTYYRKDVMDRYNMSVPQTWDEVVELLPTLQRYGLNYYIPLSTSTSSKSIMTTAPFIYQYGGSLFSEDATETTILNDTENDKSLQAIKFMTELYTLRGLPQQVSNFFDSFRNGSLPIGVSTFETYLRLTMAAPEIAGKWAIAQAPGVMNENGEIERWQTGSATAMTLLKSGDTDKDNAGWELLKWWSSKDVQTDFMNQLTMIYGKNYIWNSANLEAFKDNNAFSTNDIAVILEQWRWMREIPKVPGWYMLEREISNAWNSIVIGGANTRATIENAVDTINKELRRKLTEFGYMKDGVIIKPYKITTIEYVQQLKGGN